MFNVKLITSLPPVQLTCDLCGFVARDNCDIISIEEEKCCTECVMNFKYPMGEEAWNNGERPTQKVARERMNILIEEV